MQGDPCGICGGDGRIHNSFGLTSTCPGCHGTGRRSDEAPGLRDVTKTKPSHYQQANTGQSAQKKQTWPGTIEGAQLATEVRDTGNISVETKTRLIREIIDYEASHGKCTQTFTKKIRRQLRPIADK